MDEQILIQNDLFVLVLPREMIYQHHLLLIPLRQSAHTFLDLTETELAAMHKLLDITIEKFANDSSFEYSGYNLFCNNGSMHAGQHVNHFHMHVFVRSNVEGVSPYELLRDSKAWVKLGSKKWNENKIALVGRLSS